MNNRAKVISLFVLGSLIIFMIFKLALVKDEQSIVNFFTLYGTYASSFGILVAYIQINSIKKNTEETQIAINQTINQLTKLLTVSELATAIKLIHENQAYIGSSKYELLLLRLKDLKAFLIQISHSESFRETVDSSIFSSFLTTLSVDITNIHDLNTGQKKGVNFSTVNKNLETIETSLIEYQTSLKKINNG